MEGEQEAGAREPPLREDAHQIAPGEGVAGQAQRLDDGPQQLRGAPVIAESMTGQPEDIAGDEPEREVLQPVAQDQRLLRELARLGESPALAEVFAHDRGDQPEPALIRDRTGKGLGLPQARQHLLELAERVERGPQLKAHIDLLLSRFRRLGQVA